MMLSGARRFASSGQRKRGTALAIRAPMPPSATSGPAASRSRKRDIPGQSRSREPESGGAATPALMSSFGAIGAAPAASGPLDDRSQIIGRRAAVDLSLGLG